MATIDRPSLEKNLETRYQTQPVGGAYNAKDIVRQGGNVVSLGGSTFETNYTVTKGFKTKMAPCCAPKKTPPNFGRMSLTPWPFHSY